MKYDSSWKYYRIRIGTALTDAESQIVKSLVQQAYREYTGLDHAFGA
jgi:hypothetical protein